jgi:peptidoglycan/LPS O-acetylase OafA/YrhL
VPPLVAMLIGYLLYRYFFWPKFSDAAFDALLAFTYVSNWWRAFDLPGIGYMSHTWSLSVEEQFYLACHADAAVPVAGPELADDWRVMK